MILNRRMLPVSLLSIVCAMLLILVKATIVVSAFYAKTSLQRFAAPKSNIGHFGSKLIIGGRNNINVSEKQLFKDTTRSSVNGILLNASRQSSVVATTKADVAKELLSLLVDKQNKRNSSKKKNEKIESLIQSLITDPFKNVYNPNECLFGPLYCTVYNFNLNNPSAKDPLWERISIFDSNIKGQQYFRSSSSNNDDDVGCGSVINYSEIFGPSFHLRASGDFEPKRKPQQQKEEDETGSTLVSDILNNLSWSIPKKYNNMFLSDVLNNLSWSQQQDGSNNSNSRICPDDYTVNVKQASIHILGQQIALPIEGEGFLRVLYANPDLRIFISPIDSTSDDAVTAQGGGKWESRGLVVVQVRSDLIMKNNNNGDGQAVMDLTQ